MQLTIKKRYNKTAQSNNYKNKADVNASNDSKLLSSVLLNTLRIWVKFPESPYLETQKKIARKNLNCEKELLNKVSFSEDDFVGNFGWKTSAGKLADGYLYNLDESDQKLVKDINPTTYLSNCYYIII